MKKLIEFQKKSEQQDEINGLVFSGRSMRHTHDLHGKQHRKGTLTIYRCPMRCEGEKTYREYGRCPVCGMNLAPVR